MLNFKEATKFKVELERAQDYPTLKKYFSTFLHKKYIAEYRLNSRIIVLAIFERTVKFFPKAIPIKLEVIKNLNKEMKDLKNAELLDEEGIPPEPKLTIKEIKEMSNEELENLPASYINVVEKILSKRANNILVSDVNKKIEAHYIYGNSGVGKTTKALEMAKEYYAKHYPELPVTINWINCKHGFFHGTGDKNAKVAIYDDFRDKDMLANEFIKMIDYNKHSMNIKGGSQVNLYECIIITSVFSPNEIYNDENGREPRKQWIRRLHILPMFGIKKEGQQPIIPPVPVSAPVEPIPIIPEAQNEIINEDIFLGKKREPEEDIIEKMSDEAFAELLGNEDEDNDDEKMETIEAEDILNII